MSLPSTIVGGPVESAMDGGAPILYVHAAGRERAAVRDRLVRMGLPVNAAVDLADAGRMLTERRFVLCLLDLVEDRAGITAIRVLRTQHPAVHIAGLVDPANPVIAAEALHAGVADLLPWPFDERDIAALVANVRDRHAFDPAKGLARSASESALFVQSPAMRHVMELVRDAAALRSGVVVCGEPDSGRELVARAVHTLGTPAGPFVILDCAMSPPDLERELFGTTGARDETGRHAALERVAAASAFYRAQHGTLYLTNLIEAPARVQARLSRLWRDREAVLTDREVTVDLDVRPMAALDADVAASLADGRLRRDLFERVSHVRIDVPALRRRREDLPLLAVYFLRHCCERHDVPVKSFSRSALALLAALPWHGNGRELRGLVDTLVRAVRRPVIQLEDVLEHARLDGLAARIDEGISLKDAKARFERECISAVLLRHHGRVGEAAKALGIQRTNLYRKVRQLKVARSLLGPRK